jgi:Polymer-forming cytoskeletal
VQPHDQAWAKSEPTTKAGTASCIGSDMSIVGKIDCKGPAQIFGRIEGELRASDLLISDGAQVEGNVIAQNVQSAAASRALSVLSASSCRTVVRWRMTFFIGRCRSTRTLSLRDKVTSPAQSLVPLCAHRRLRTAQESYSP